MNQADLLEKEPVFQLKGSMLALTILELTSYDLDALALLLVEKAEQAPQFFQDAPIILALDKCNDDPESLDLASLLAVCREHGLSTMAIRSDRPADLAAAKALQITVIPPSDARERPLTALQTTEVPAEPSLIPAKIIIHPVRSGQQIVAKNCDLIVLAAVSAGAELLADGNIHVYGPLRGRALAGINGNCEARIFCQQLGAELLSIAGQYKVAEDLRRDPAWGKPTQTWLNGEQLEVSVL